jgi:putative glutamine amidotransferase
VSAVPVIGISCYVEEARWAAWDKRAALLPYGYVERVTAAGGRAVLLPPGDGAVLDRLDGLLLAGGADVEPQRYGAEPHPSTLTRPDRDAGELALLHAALDLDLPVLGICRGMQLLAVGYGGRLTQHLPDLLGDGKHQPAPGVYGSHPVTVVPGSRLYRILGPEVDVNSYHHQAVADPGPLKVTAHSPDGVVEALEDPARRFVLGVQWHPEEMSDGRIFEAFVRMATMR